MKPTLPVMDQFEKDGVVCVRGAFGPEWIALAARGIDLNIAQPGPFFQRLSKDGGDGFLSDMWGRRHIEEFERFALQSPAATLAARCLQADRVRLLQDTWFLKRSGASERTPWHHDNVIVGPFCSVWVALDATPRDTTLEFVRGSHRWGKLFMPKSFFEKRDPAEMDAVERFYADYHGARPDGDIFTEIPDIEADRAAYDIIGWDLEPGDCVIFDARTVHGSPGNRLAHDVRRFVTRWITDAAVLAPHGRPLVDQLVKAGFNLDLAVGRPVVGAFFPEIHVVAESRDPPAAGGTRTLN
jgi:ectoine hydroxylase-related dioxygenase (phytanoyl-CoA dioxygenase family)